VSKIERTALVVYGHFSQPPRGNPLTYEIGEEADAAPYKNWNEHINATSYAPNADAGNFNHITFSVSEGLMKWFEQSAPETYQKIVEGDKQSVAAHPPAGNALATAHNHVILPLSRKRDKRTQIIWGIAAFERHFGRKPFGFWLPEMAVDTESLQFLADAGVGYTVLTGKQVIGLPPGGGAGPYRVELPNGKSISVFVRHDALSTELSFKVHNLGGAGHWAHNALSPARKSVGSLLLLATAGETFGHHFAGEEQFLYWLVQHEANKAGYELTTLDQVFLNNQPSQTVKIVERSGWGDQPGLSQWFMGAIENGKDTTWKGALRRALDNAASDLDRIYEDLLAPYEVDPYVLRDQYLPAVFTGKTPEEFIAEMLPKMKDKQRQQLAAVLQAQRLTQRMYNSYTFTDNQLDGRQPRYAIACAATALSLAQQATGRDMNDRLPVDLAVVTSPHTSVTGTDMLQDAIREFDLSLMKA
jgi:alpha-amylase/alpha-mannosidase (GH57 family)